LVGNFPKPVNAGQMIGHEFSMGLKMVPLSDINLEATIGGIFGNDPNTKTLLFSEMSISLLY